MRVKKTFQWKVLVKNARPVAGLGGVKPPVGWDQRAMFSSRTNMLPQALSTISGVI
jgi:hypothetical protein